MTHFTRNAWLAIGVKGASSFGSFVAMVAFSSYIYITTGNPISVGIFLTCHVSGGILGSFCASAIFRRFKSLSALFFLNIVRLVAISTLLWLPVSAHVHILPAIGLAIGMCGTAFGAGLNSQLPEWIDEKRLVHVNGYISVMSGISIVAGSLFAGLIISFSGFNTVFTVAALGYLLSGIFVTGIKTSNNSPSLKKPSIGSIREDMVKLMRAVKTAPTLSLMLWTTLVDTLGSASHNVGFPILSKILVPENAAATMGYILSTWAGGQMIGARIIASYLKTKTVACMEKTYFLGVACMSCGFILAFWQSSLMVALLFFVMAGIGDGVSEVSFVTRAQHTEKPVRLLLFSTMGLMQQSGFGLGMLISSFVFSLLPASYVVSVFHGIPLLLIGCYVAIKVFLAKTHTLKRDMIP